MNNHQRGVYQPLMDNIPIYDLSDEEIEEEERSRLPLLIVIALVVLAAFAGVVWLAYNQGVARGRASAAVVIAAPEGPEVRRPTDAGGEATPIRVRSYGQPVPPDQERNLRPGAGCRAALFRRALAARVVADDRSPPVRLNPDAQRRHGVGAARRPREPVAQRRPAIAVVAAAGTDPPQPGPLRRACGAANRRLRNRRCRWRLGSFQGSSCGRRGDAGRRRREGGSWHQGHLVSPADGTVRR